MNLDKVKSSNEFTVKVIVDKNAMLSFLKENHFEMVSSFSLDDYYFVPADLDLKNTSTRDILSKAILYRNIYENGVLLKKLAFKKKTFDENGNIIDQKAFYCDVSNEDEAKNFITAIGYKEIMNIKENSMAFKNDILSFALKDIENGDLLMEFELDEKCACSTMEELKSEIIKASFPILKDEFFIKKAEICLDKILGRG